MKTMMTSPSLRTLCLRWYLGTEKFIPSAMNRSTESFQYFQRGNTGSNLQFLNVSRRNTCFFSQLFLCKTRSLAEILERFSNALSLGSVETFFGHS